MPRDRTIESIELPAADPDAVKAFCPDAFDRAFTDLGPGYAAFNDGHMDGGFYCASFSSAAELAVVQTDVLEATLDMVAACGGRIVNPVFAFPGGRRCHSSGPAGSEPAVWSASGG